MTSFSQTQPKTLTGKSCVIHSNFPEKDTGAAGSDVYRLRMKRWDSATIEADQPDAAKIRQTQEYPEIIQFGWEAVRALHEIEVEQT